MLCGHIFENRIPQNSDCNDPRTMMLFWDTGASYGLTPFRSDFIEYVECNIPVKNVDKENRLIIIETNLHNFIESNSQNIFLPCIPYDPTQTYVQFLSPRLTLKRTVVTL